MATPSDNQTNIEALQIKCFLYKYTPPFTVVVNPPSTQSSTALSSFTAYSTILDDTQYYTKYDLTDFVVSYSFEQNINETTYAWNVEFQDLALSFSTIDTKLKVPSSIKGVVGYPTSGLAFSTDTNSIVRLSQYEVNASSDTTIDLNIVETAKKNRG
jgi:predicted metalloendopeptidase